MGKNRTEKAPISMHKDISIHRTKNVPPTGEYIYGGSINLAEYKQLSLEERHALIDRTLRDYLPSREDLRHKFAGILDNKDFFTFTLVSVTPNVGRLGTKVKVLAQLGLYDVADCFVDFSSTIAGNNTGTITSKQNVGDGQIELTVTVPDFPGASGNVSIDVTVKHLTWYEVQPPDINTPPMRFSLIDAVSNAVSFTWQPSQPVIDKFEANSQTGTAEVEPGTDIQLLWRVHNITEITISSASNVGPAPSIHDVFPSVQGFVENSRDIGVFIGDTLREEVYTLTARNPWGTAIASVHVQLRERPFIRILGAEVAQAIQHFTLDSSATVAGTTIQAAEYNNSVGLIERKRTMVRVYVDSGMNTGFRTGAGPNEQPNVVGTVTLTLMDGTTRTASAIRNAAGMVIARPKSAIDRANYEHTLNIELPWDCLENEVKMDVRVWVSSDIDNINHSGDAPYSGYAYDKHLGSFTFTRRRHLRLARILVQDDNLGLAAPSNADYWTSVEGLLARYPIAYDSVEVVLPLATGDDVYETTCDLTTDDGWKDLLDDIEDVADEYENNEEYWTAIVVDDSRYSGLNGISQSSWFLDVNPHPCLIARAALRATFPHELGHNLGFGHSNCGNPDGVEPDLPAHTDELGIDLQLGELIPVGYGDLMSYCIHYAYQMRWPSLTLWLKLFDKLAP